MPVRRVLPARGEPHARHKQAWLARIPEQNDSLRRAFQRCFEYDFRWKLDNGCIALCESSRSNGTQNQCGAGRRAITSCQTEASNFLPGVYSCLVDTLSLTITISNGCAPHRLQGRWRGPAAAEKLTVRVGSAALMPQARHISQSAPLVCGLNYSSNTVLSTALTADTAACVAAGS
jgi:hypothetical protein